MGPRLPRRRGAVTTLWDPGWCLQEFILITQLDVRKYAWQRLFAAAFAQVVQRDGLRACQLSLSGGLGKYVLGRPVWHSTVATGQSATLYAEGGKKANGTV